MYSVKSGQEETRASCRQSTSATFHLTQKPAVNAAAHLAALTSRISKSSAAATALRSRASSTESKAPTSADWTRASLSASWPCDSCFLISAASFARRALRWINGQKARRRLIETIHSVGSHMYRPILYCCATLAHRMFWTRQRWACVQHRRWRSLIECGRPRNTYLWRYERK